MRMVPIGELVESVEKRDPRSELDGPTFTYVDIGAVSQDTKQVEEPQEVICAEAPSRARQLIAENDIVVSTVRPNLNAVAKIDGQFNGSIASTGFSVLRPDQNKLSPSYLYHWVRTETFVKKMMMQATGQSYPAVSDKIVKASQIPLPPLEEQKRIAGILDQADALRRLRTRALDKLNTLGQAIFHEMFGDPFEAGKSNQVRELKDLTTRITYGFTSPMSHHAEGIPILTAKSVQNGFIDYSSCKYAIQHEVDALSEKSKPERGDLLITKDGTIGRYAVFDENFPVCINQSVALVKPNFEKIVPEYLAAYVGSAGVQRRFQGMKKGNALPHLQITELAKFPIFAPSFNDQSELKRRLSGVEILKSKLAADEAKTEALFSSLQHRAFRGEL